MRASQLIFTRVEPAYSPRRQNGFQIVYKSEDISDSEAKEIQGLIEAYNVTRDPSPRWQYLVLSSGRVLVSQTHVIETDTTIVDRMGREGAFIVHCYVVTADDLRATPGPFGLLDQDIYAHTLDDLRALIQEFGPATGIAKIVDVRPVNPGHGQIAWADAEKTKLISLAVNGEALRKMKKSLLIVGTQQEILDTLRLAFASGADRTACTFNSNMERMQLPIAGTYWAVGVPTAQNMSGYIEVNVSQRRVNADVEALFPRGNSLYDVWFEAKKKQNQIGTESRHGGTIKWLDEAFTAKRVLSQTEVEQLKQNREAFESFESVHRDLIATRVQDAVRKHISSPASLVEKLVAFIMQQAEIVHAFAIAIPGQIAPSFLIHAARSMIGAFPDFGEKSLSDSESDALQKFAHQYPDAEDSAVLEFWTAAYRIQSTEWAIRQMRKSVRARHDEKSQALKKMNRDQYRDTLEKLFKPERKYRPLEPKDFVAPGMKPELLPYLLEDRRLDKMTRQQFFDLMEALLDADFNDTNIHIPDVLLRHVTKLDAEQLEHLEKRLPNVSPPGPLMQRIRAIRAGQPVESVPLIETPESDARYRPPASNRPPGHDARSRSGTPSEDGEEHRTPDDIKREMSKRPLTKLSRPQGVQPPPADESRTPLPTSEDDGRTQRSNAYNDSVTRPSQRPVEPDAPTISHQSFDASDSPVEESFEQDTFTSSEAQDPDTPRRSLNAPPPDSLFTLPKKDKPES